MQSWPNGEIKHEKLDPRSMAVHGSFVYFRFDSGDAHFYQRHRDGFWHIGMLVTRRYLDNIPNGDSTLSNSVLEYCEAAFSNQLQDSWSTLSFFNHIKGIARALAPRGGFIWWLRFFGRIMGYFYT